jgi:thiol-disulfide isomerase/thioredoxin
MSLPRIIAVLLVTAPFAVTQPCEAPTDVQAVIDGVVFPPGAARADRTSAARAIRDRFPDDYFAHRFYQEQFFSGGTYSKDVQGEYRNLLAKHADEVLYVLLAARVLKGTDTPTALKLLDQVLAREPGSPQAQLKLVEIYSSFNFSDPVKLRRSAEQYWKSCPDSLQAYNYVGNVRDEAFNGAAAGRLRTLLEKRSDDEALRMYGRLWNMEFRAVPLAEQDPVREQIRKDVARLRALDSEKRPWLVAELRQGYQFLSDDKGVKWAEERLPKPEGAAETIARWRTSQNTADYQSFAERMAKQCEEWIKKWPEDPQVRFECFQNISSADSVTLEEAIKAADDWIEVFERHPGPYFSPYMQVANFYSRFRVRFDRIPTLLEKALKPQTPDAPVNDLWPTRPPSLRNLVYDKESAARIYLQIKNYDKARELLKEIEPEVEKQRPSETASDSEKRSFAIRESNFARSLQRIALADGRKQDALTYGKREALAMTRVNPNDAGMYRSNLLRLWKEVKGSEQGFDEWFGQPKAASDVQRAAVVSTPGNWSAISKPLPDFKIEDAQGKTWRLEDLKGKVTLINLWATWCGPCRAELPHLEKLAARVKDRSEFAVITLNTDDQLGLIQPFLRENKYTFPVLPAAEYVHVLVPELSIPRNWIVDAEGTLRQERIGFGGDGERWIEDVIAMMEKARK